MGGAEYEADVHPDAARLRRFAQGLLPPDECRALEEHLSDCDRCGRVLEAAPEGSFVSRLRAARDTPPAATECYGAATEAAELSDLGGLADHPRYRVIRLLGRGGMGAVYLAEHRRMGRLVALKVIDPALLDHADALRRFQQEVQAAAQLHHPNIVAAFDADQAGGAHFLVMEYVAGRNLADYLAASGPLPVAAACAYVRQAALGLAHAHERGMVHRDIKPHNLMLTPQGQVKVLDFGLARFATESGGAAPSAAAALPHLTGAGAVMGTADYIAPEQARDAHAADERSDIYSLGCTLYHLLTGRPPFAGGSAEDKLRRHDVETAPALRGRRAVPEGLARLVARMMAKRPADRPRTAAEVAAALQAFAPRRSRRRRPVLAVLVVLLVAAACGTTYGLRGGDRPQPDGPAPAVAPVTPPVRRAPEQLLAPGGLVRRWTGHGVFPVHRIAVAADGTTAWSAADDLRRWDIATGTTRGSYAPAHLDWLYPPDGRWPGRMTLGQVARAQWHDDLLPTPDGKELWTTDGAGGFIRRYDAVTLATTDAIGPGPARFWQAAWFPGGRRLLTGGDDGLARVWDIQTRAVLHEYEGHACVSCVDVSPDGSRLLTGSTEDRCVHVWDVATRTFVTLSEQVGQPGSARFVAGGTAVLSCGRDRTIRLFDARTGAERRAYDCPARRTPWATLAPLPGGREFVSAADDGVLRLWDFETARELYHAPLEDVPTALAVTADGAQVLVGTQGGEVLQWRLPRLESVVRGP